MRAGLLPLRAEPGAAHRYSFADVLILKTTKRLLDAGVSIRRIRRALRSAAGHTDQADALTQLAIEAEHGNVVVRRGGVRWQPESGQLLLRFADRPAAPEVTLLARQKRRNQLNADQWYELAVSMESSSVSGAMDAYRRALQEDPGLSAALINLGRLLHMTGDLEAARLHYRRAMELDPFDPIPVFNLGVVLEDTGQADEAMELYQLALQRDPLLGDAHYNLALLYQQRGSYWEALRHFRTYKRLNESSPGGSR